MSYFIKKIILNGVIIQTPSSKFLEDTAANHSKCIVKHAAKKYKEKKMFISAFLTSFPPSHSWPTEGKNVHIQ